MSRRHFGTDGVRGLANVKLTADLALALGRATGRFLRETTNAPVVVIGRDTRRSGPMLQGAFAAGLQSAGVDVDLAGVCPTPTVSHAVRTSDRLVLGAVISASHNPAPDNGIKLFGTDGRKLPDAAESRIEALMDEPFAPGEVGRGTGDEIPGYAERYLEWLVGLGGNRIEGMRVAIDAAHGAAAVLGPDLFRRLGAQVYATGISPDGDNINAEGGATKPSRIAELVAETGAEVGIAFDGDADRAVFCDASGRLINGDRVIGAWAKHERADRVVGTVMSNGGYEAWLRSQGIALERADVGDKYVAARMTEVGARIGGEQSGHLIFPAHSPTGDGLLTAVEFLRVLGESGRSAADVADDFENWPQSLVNVGVASKEGWQSVIADEIATAERLVAGRGRVNVRASGTQPMLRVMVEADDAVLRDEASETVVRAMETKLGGEVHGRVELTHALGD